MGVLDATSPTENLELLAQMGHTHVCCGCQEALPSTKCICGSGRFMPIEQAIRNLKASDGKSIFEQKRK